ncbi:MAG: hypothetical protein ACYTG0_31260 [Planctomycetota bacterium]|jgi:hypothetical protein
MTRVAQKDEELFYLDEFLRNQLMFDVTVVTPALKDPPDGSASITNTDGRTLLFDFEIAEYYVDDPRDGDGGSPSKRVSGCWDKVRGTLDPQLEALRLPVDVGVRFKEPGFLKNRHVGEFAGELIRFAQEFCPTRHLERTHHDAFSSASYPLLHQHVERITLTHLEDTVVIGWHCSNIAAACVGVVRSHLSNLVRRKSAKNFTWAPGAEKCLLIYASGGTVTSRAGPPPPDPSIWDDKELTAACSDSVFDRVYFWERVRSWHKRLK